MTTTNATMNYGLYEDWKRMKREFIKYRNRAPFQALLVIGTGAKHKIRMLEQPFDIRYIYEQLHCRWRYSHGMESSRSRSRICLNEIKDGVGGLLTLDCFFLPFLHLDCTALHDQHDHLTVYSRKCNRLLILLPNIEMSLVHLVAKKEGRIYDIYDIYI